MSRDSRRRFGRLEGFALAAVVTVLVGCGHSQPLQPLPPLTLAPDFSLQDVNPNSATSAQLMSPRAQLGKVSAWYFGHST